MTDSHHCSCGNIGHCCFVEGECQVFGMSGCVIITGLEEARVPIQHRQNEMQTHRCLDSMRSEWIHEEETTNLCRVPVETK